MRIVATLQDRAAGLLGLDPGRRTPLVRAMLHRPRGDAAGYWLQLLISAGLATLGLALDSTAVVIGAMLIAPLMRPIVELAMGLATGSPPLVFRTGLRAIASVAVVVLASAGFAWMLPFHEVTPELLARTAPSILDLFVAAACALAGAYAVVIASSDVATTAAGTSIGISLVPPLCTAGYGVSIGDWDMAIGAGLLFTANVTGIVTVASAVFVIVGFGQVNIREEEQTLDDDVNIGYATRFGRRVSRRSARLNIAARLVLPLVMLAGVAYPLLKAVDEMSRRSSVRQRVASLMNDNDERIVQYALDQAARPITLRVVLVGEPADARQMEQRLRGELAALGEPEAAVAVWAVSDATAVSALSAKLDDVPAVLPPPPVAPPPEPLDRRVRAAWPASGGPLLAVWTADGSPPRVRLTHLGPEIGAVARDMLAKAVSTDQRPTIEEIALVPVVLDEHGILAWLPRALAMLARARDLPGVYFCVTRPPPPPPRRPRGEPVVDLAVQLVEAEIAGQPNISLVVGEQWRVVPQAEACAEPQLAAP